MATPEEQRELERRFRALVESAVAERWEREGRFSAKDILADVRSDEEVWRGMLEQWAQQAAATAIRRQIAARDHGAHPSQGRFPFADELPLAAITYKGSVVATSRSTADEYLWFSRWYEKRHTGTVRRSGVDKKTLAKVQRLARIVEKYEAAQPGMTLQEILLLRQERLNALHKQRRKKQRPSH